MSTRINFRFVRLFALSMALFGLQAFAQFEVSPDHFDSQAARQTHRRAAKSQPKTKSTTAAAANRRKSTVRKNKTAGSQQQTAAVLRVR